MGGVVKFDTTQGLKFGEEIEQAYTSEMYTATSIPLKVAHYIDVG